MSPVSVKLINCLHHIIMSRDWQELVKEKRARQAASIPKEWLITPPPENQQDVTMVARHCGLISAKEITITETHVQTLLSNISKGEWSAVEVTKAFCKRAIIAHQIVRHRPVALLPPHIE